MWHKILFHARKSLCYLTYLIKQSNIGMFCLCVMHETPVHHKVLCEQLRIQYLAQGHLSISLKVFSYLLILAECLSYFRHSASQPHPHRYHCPQCLCLFVILDMCVILILVNSLIYYCVKIRYEEIVPKWK